MESNTSKTSSLQALLLRAWRERWTDLQWGINIKTILPRGVSGDVYNLADCILQQAVVGSGANQLALSYLKHSLSVQLVSHAAVLQHISQYSQLQKTHCVYSLLEFLEGVFPGITYCGKAEETALATALLSIASWLLQVLLNCYSTPQLLEKANSLIKTLLQSEFYIAMMCLSRYSESELFCDVTKKCEEVEACLADKEEILESVRLLKKLDVASLPLPPKSDNGPGCLVQAWMAIQLVQQPGSPTQVLVRQLRLIQRLKGYTDARLYSELMRASLLSLQNVSQTPHESQWGAFAFLKVPHVIAAMVDKANCLPVVSAIELLLQHAPLIDTMDARCSCSCLECLLGELEKARLLTDIQVEMFIQRRDVPKSIKLDTAPATTGIPKVIICAEPTLTGIVKTLSTDYHQEALLGMLHQVLTGKSFELILAVATVEGQLRTLATRLIRFNECSKMGGDKAKAQLFDISFLMLVSIVQNYGAETVLEPGGDSTLEQWVRECMVEVNRPKPPEQLLRLSDPIFVDSLLQQFNVGESDFKSPVKWQEVLFNMAGVMKEVLVAWEQGALAPADVKRILDAVRGRMCCLPVAAAAWLCAYMRTAPQDTILKPVNMVQQLLSPPIAEDDSLRERWQLSCEIIRKMQRDLQLPLQAKSVGNMVFRQPATEQLHNAWLKAISRGWLDHNSGRNMQCLLEMAGARWMVAAIVQELLQLRDRDELERGVDLALAIFQLDIEACARDLLSHVLPQQLHNSLQSDTLIEPQLSALARLASYVTYSACDLSVKSEEVVPPPAKFPRLLESSGSDSITVPLRHLLTALEGTVQDGQITQQTYFAFQLLFYLVDVRSNSTPLILAAIPPALIADLLRTLPELFNSPLLLHLHDVSTQSGRTNMAKDLCMLRNYQLRKNVYTS
ncbi:mediator of RNA polymerase II transcription subunit 24 [Photinus pyralis]|uniref:Mediator of RNA polymerase II transcription subunit 24 n=1 Tax=Photinus pyralis TaxID=7054 RepID=A0A1Y1L3D3_PHOPY|nr:mediator of RNA polymerase II transcription subunit 24 [Photinus pyralis]